MTLTVPWQIMPGQVIAGQILPDQDQPLGLWRTFNLSQVSHDESRAAR
jgi:hypothetical protein